MVGMIIGAFLWGILGDKKGRKSALFGSIILYSVATMLNGFATSIPAYALFRFLAGIGLAGEVGAAMTMAAEVTPAKYRSYGTAAVAGLGVFGAVLASFIGGLLPWRMGFLTGGAIGILLLLARLSMKESVLFVRMLHDKTIERGSISLLFLNKKRLMRLMRCTLSAIPLWFAVGVLVSFAPEVRGVAGATNMSVNIATIALFYSIGETLGEVVSGLFSQWLRSRKLAMLIFAAMAFISTLFVLKGPVQFYALFCAPLGFFVGYWSVAITTTAEQFGTNIRATATTLVPNFIRASTIPITLLFSALAGTVGALESAMITGALCFVAAIISILCMEETFGKDLDFVEFDQPKLTL
jgi:MFS family permease